MLKVIRALGFLAPAAVAICVVVVLALIADAPDERTRWSILMPTLLAAGAGILTTLCVAWAYGAWRLDRLARRLEETLEADEPIALHESGVAAEQRLARAFNKASRAFVQTEVRATHDRLTGVPNRETLLTALVSEVERAARYRHWLSVAFIDIDRFKPINDTYGHNAGDAVLRQIATVVAQSLREIQKFQRDFEQLKARLAVGKAQENLAGMMKESVSELRREVADLRAQLDAFRRQFE